MSSLKHVKTGKGKCRAWIRMALNEASFESFLNMFVADQENLAKFYTMDSFLRQPEACSRHVYLFALTCMQQASLVAMLLSGLETLSFKLTVVRSASFHLLQPSCRIRVVSTPSKALEVKFKLTISQKQPNLTIMLLRWIRFLIAQWKPFK